VCWQTEPAEPAGRAQRLAAADRTGMRCAEAAARADMLRRRTGTGSGRRRCHRTNLRAASRRPARARATVLRVTVLRATVLRATERHSAAEQDWQAARGALPRPLAEEDRRSYRWGPIEWAKPGQAPGRAARQLERIPWRTACDTNCKRRWFRSPVRTIYKTFTVSSALPPGLTGALRALEPEAGAGEETPCRFPIFLLLTVGAPEFQHPAEVGSQQRTAISVKLWPLVGYCRLCRMLPRRCRNATQ